MPASPFDTLLDLAADVARTAAAVAAVATTNDGRRIAARLYIEAALLGHEAWAIATTDEEKERAHGEAGPYGRAGSALLEGAPSSLTAY